MGDNSIEGRLCLATLAFYKRCGTCYKSEPMNSTATPHSFSYFPAILCVECDSPIDALVALCVPRDEATELVAASWRGNVTRSLVDTSAIADVGTLVATLDGGRSVAVLPTPEGRWAACNAFLDPCYATPQEAERRLGHLLKRGRRGYVGVLAGQVAPDGGNA